MFKIVFYLILSGLLLAAVLPGCAPQPEPAAPLLNSERIGQRYGSYGVAVLEQRRTRRLACLYSGARPLHTCRTIAVVEFTADPASGLAQPLATIRAGGSLGATLVEAGFEVRKVTLYIDRYRLPGGNASRWAGWFRMAAPVDAAVHVYRLEAVDGGTALPVATVLEVHHPDYLSPGELRRLYRDLPAEPAGADDIAGWRRLLDTLADPSARL